MPIIDDVRDRVSKMFPQKHDDADDDPANEPRDKYGRGIRNFTDEQMIVPKGVIVAHTVQAFFEFLGMCCFASVSSFQAHWGVGPTFLSGIAVFISVMDLFLSLFLVIIPVLCEKYDKFIRLARALKEDRVSFILVGTGAISMTFISFITTISAFTEAGCKNPDNDPHAKLGDDFKNALSGWCSTKKAGAVFFWLATFGWIASSVLVFLDWRSGKRRRTRDPPFTHPQDPTGYAPSINTRDDDYDVDEERHPGYNNPNPGPSYGNVAPRLPPVRQSTNITSPFGDEHRSSYQPPRPQSAAPRQSMDAYGAFSDPEPSGYTGAGAGGSADPGVSRTMQFADPYAAVKANIAAAGHSPRQGTSPRPGASPQSVATTLPTYDYQGYR